MNCEIIYPAMRSRTATHIVDQVLEGKKTEHYYCELHAVNKIEWTSSMFSNLRSVKTLSELEAEFWKELNS